MILALIRGVLPSIRTVKRDRKWGDSERGEDMHQRVTGEFKLQLAAVRTLASGSDWNTSKATSGR